MIFRNDPNKTLKILTLLLWMTCRPVDAACPDSRGTEYWLCFPTKFNFQSEQMYFMITGTSGTIGSVDVPGLTFHADFTLPAEGVKRIDVPYNTMLNTSGEVTMGWQDRIFQKGVHLTADQPVAVYGFNVQMDATDAYLGLPVDALGTEYMAMSHHNTMSYGSEVAVVATENNTSVTMTLPQSDGIRLAGVPYVVTLQEGEVYQFVNDITDTGDMTGTIVQSDKPVAVFGANMCSRLPDTTFGACNHIVEQMLPLNALGTRYLTVPFAGRLLGDTFRFLSTEDGTIVTVNGTSPVTLDRGKFEQRILEGYNVIEADHPILVCQYANCTTYDDLPGFWADPSMMLVLPPEQYTSDYTVTTAPEGFTDNYVNVVAPMTAITSILMDGSSLSPSDFAPIGTSGYGGARYLLTAGVHRFTGPTAFGLYSYGWDQFDAYSYPSGMAVVPVPPAGSTLSLSPIMADRLVGETHCVAATVLDGDSAPLRDVRVDFEVSGAHTNGGSICTDAAGRAEYCYPGIVEGSDAIRAAQGTRATTVGCDWHFVITTPTITPTFTMTPTATRTWTRTLTPTPSPTRTLTATATRTRTSTPTASATSTSTRTFTPTWTETPSPTRTSTITATPTATLIDGCDLLWITENIFHIRNGNRTAIRLRLCEAGFASVFVYNSAGEKVRTLLVRTFYMSSVNLTLDWDGRNDRGEKVASGVYLVHLEGSRSADTRKLLVLR